MADPVSDEEDYGEFYDHVDLKSAAISVPEGEPAVVVFGSYLLSVERLRVTHPDREDVFCPIYGQIYIFNIGNPSYPRVTLFNRPREDAQTVAIGDPKQNFLPLNDGDSTAQPVRCDCTICVTMKLFEKKETVDQDTLIAKIECEFGDFNDCNAGKRMVLKLKSESGFMFTLSYSILTRAILAEVEFRINRDIYEDTAVRANKKHKCSNEDIYQDTVAAEANKIGKGSILIYGLIEARQLMETKTSLRLFYFRRNNKAESVEIGSPIDLDRKFVVVPIGDGALLIDYTFLCPSTKNVIAKGTVPFYIKPLECTQFIANRSLKHTKHVENGLFSVSIKFIPIIPALPLEEYI